MLPTDYGTTADIVISADDISDESTAEPFETESEADMTDAGTETDTSVVEQTEPVPVTESSAVEPITTDTDAPNDTAEVNETEQKPMTTAAPPGTTVPPTVAETVPETAPLETADVPKTSVTTQAPETTAAPETSPQHTHTWEDENSIHSYDDNKITCTVCGIAKCEVMGHYPVIMHGKDKEICIPGTCCLYCLTELDPATAHDWQHGVCARCDYIDWGSSEAAYTVSERTVYYINKCRTKDGGDAAEVLKKGTEVAMYRAQQLVKNFAHDVTDEREAYALFEHGKYVEPYTYTDPTTGETVSAGGYFEVGGEAIGICAGAYCDELAKSIADLFYGSPGHWDYVGSARYIAVGIYNYGQNYIAIFTSDVNYG